MNKKEKLRGLTLLGAGLATLALSGCLNTGSMVDETASSSATLTDSDFPSLNKVWNRQVISPSPYNLNNVRVGVSKSEVAGSIGSPHFDEGFFSKEWNYAFEFNTTGDERKLCQYKVSFDRDKLVTSTQWKDESCAKHTEVNVLPPVVSNSYITQKQGIQFKLSSDALFGFDKYSFQDISVQGKSELNKVAEAILDAQSKGDIKVVVTGHTDHKGSDTYNLALSQLRANTVRSYLVRKGVDSSSLIAVGAGESEPKVECGGITSKASEIECLKPNRRVTVDISGYVDSE